jgi:Fe-S-cluster containining protein
VDANTLQAPREAQLSTLCQGCGFCCDGTLFTHVALEQAEARRLEGGPARLVLRTGGRGAGAALVQHCGALEGCRCAVYPLRPRGCRLFTCLLGRALLDGEVGLEEAQRQVEDTRARREALGRLLPARPPLTPVLAEARRRAAVTAGPLALSPAAREALAALERHLAFHFHRP